MATRTVRLDDEAEKTLKEIKQATGMSVSAALKHGLIVLREEIVLKASTTPYSIYEQLDLGPGGYAIAPAKQARLAVRGKIRRKLGR